jgi:hypothetical protein
MTIWGLIEEDHHHLEAMIDRLEQEHERDELVQQFAYELTADLAAEEKALYEPLYKRPGFRRILIEILADDEEMRRMAEQLPALARASRPGRIRELKAALAKHVEHDTYLLPVAHKELPFHVAEHMKHEYEWAKHAAMRRLTDTTELTPVDSDLRGVMEALEIKQDTAHERRIVEDVLKSEQASAFVAQSALDRSEEASHRSLLGEIAESHLRYAHKLGTALTALDDKPRRHKGGGSFGGWARVLSAAFAGEKALLRTIKSHEERARHEHERMVRGEHARGGIRTLLEHLIEHGHQHEQKLDAAVAAYPQDVCASFSKA